MAKVILTVGNFEFEAAHNLIDYKGKCANLHGHSYKLSVSVTGEVDENTGMVADFGEIKKIIKSEIIDQYDHTYLNDMFESNPTAENMVVDFWFMLHKALYEKFGNDVQLYSVKLWETSGNCAEVTI